MAQALGVKVYTIGVGSRGTARVPIDDPRVGRRYVTIQVDVDEPTLQAVAETTGGLYFRATDTEGLAQIYQEIDALETTEIEQIQYVRYTELAPYFMLAALGFLAAETLLSRTRLARFP